MRLNATSYIRLLLLTLAALALVAPTVTLAQDEFDKDVLRHANCVSLRGVNFEMIREANIL